MTRRLICWRTLVMSASLGGSTLTKRGLRPWSVRPDSLTQWTMLTETLGYHVLMASDHLAITPDAQECSPAPFYEPFTTPGMAHGRDAAHRDWYDDTFYG